MATAKTMEVKVTWADRKIPISLNPSDTIADLKALICDVIGMKAEAQKLIYKGRALTDLDKTLAAYKVKPRAKILLLGQVADPARDAISASIVQEKEATDRQEAVLAAARIEVDGIGSGFLPADQQPRALKRLRMAVLGVAEELLRGLERLDACEIPREDEAMRSKRKDVIRTIERVLTAADAETERIVTLTKDVTGN